LDEFGIQEHKNLYQFYTLEKDNFANQFKKEVLATLLNPQLLKSDFISKKAREKANQYLSIKNFSIGAYSHSRGHPIIRKNLVNNFYRKRDGNTKIIEDDIYLVNGSMNAYDNAISLICNPGETVILPNPCYKLYMNFNHAYGLKNIFYDIDLHKLILNVSLFLYYVVISSLL